MAKAKKSFVQILKDTFVISKTDTSQKKMAKIIAIIAVVLIVAAIVLGVLVINKYARHQSTLNDLKDLISSEVSSDNGDESSSSGEDVSSQEEFDQQTGVLSKFAELYKLNKDFIGWISVPGTKLDTPVVLGPDQSYYLTHSLKKEYDPFGVPYIDSRATVIDGYQSDVLTIYGHNSKDGTYFESVKNYSDINYYKEHPIIEFDTIYGTAKYIIIGRFTEYVKGDFFNYHDYVNLTEKQFNTYLKELDKRNYYNTGIDVKYGDSLIALSTCNDDLAPAKGTPYRDVLVARKVRDGEEATVDVSKITPNTDMVMPKGYQDKYGKANPYK